MLDTADWPEKKLDVLKQLHLDPKNVRLEIDPKVEVDILEDLFVNENALGIVEGICKVGYLTHDVPIAIKRKGKYIMVEGNRRLAALKAIQNPQLVPDYKARVDALAKELDDRSSLSTIKVMVASSQDEADQLVAAIHTGNLRRPWSPARQAAFFQAQIDAGKKYKDLLARYPTVDVRKFVFRANMLNEFRSANFKDLALKDYLDSKAWTRGLSVLARIYESKDFLDLTGFKMDEKGQLSKSVSNKAFDKMASIIVGGMEDGSLNTRSLNSVKSPRFVLLMDELRAVVNKKKRPSSGGAGGGAKDGKATGGSTSKANGGTGSKPRPGPKQRFLDLGQVVPPATYPVAVTRCIQELTILDVQKCPNAAFLLMRAVLEKTIKAFADAKEEDIRQSGNNDKGRVQLSQALKWLLAYVKKNEAKGLIDSIERVRKGKLIYTSQTQAMNAVNHNHLFSVDPDEALQMWDAIDPIMRYVTKA